MYCIHRPEYSSLCSGKICFFMSCFEVESDIFRLLYKALQRI